MTEIAAYEIAVYWPPEGGEPLKAKIVDTVVMGDPSSKLTYRAHTLKIGRDRLVAAVRELTTEELGKIQDDRQLLRGKCVRVRKSEPPTVEAAKLTSPPATFVGPEGYKEKRLKREQERRAAQEAKELGLRKKDAAIHASQPARKPPPPPPEPPADPAPSPEVSGDA